MDADVAGCLPEWLRRPETSVTRVAAGLSGAGVYRVTSGEAAFVLKVAADSEDDAEWRRSVDVQRLAASIGVAPAVVHVNAADGRRAVLSEYVADQGFVSFYRGPETHDRALQALGTTLRAVHDLPVPEGAPATAPGVFLERAARSLDGFALPSFAYEALARALAVPAPVKPRRVLSHNDVNPTNLAFDGQRVRLLDWAAAAENEEYFDLASAALFLRMEADECLQLLGAYAGGPVTTVPERFTALRRLVGAMVGAIQLRLARAAGHAGATGAETPASIPSLAEVYQRLRTGDLILRAPEGLWTFGLSMMKESLGT